MPDGLNCRGEADSIGAMSKPEAVLEKYYPGALPILEANGHKLQTEDLWPVTSIRKARLILGWEPQYTFETWLTGHGWKGK